MRKAIFILLIVSLAFAGGYKVSFEGGWMGKQDSGFKDIYGNGGIALGGMFEAGVLSNFSLYAGYLHFGKEGETLTFGEKAETAQDYISFGMGYGKNIAPGLEFGIWGGGVYIKYTEKAIGEEIKDSCMGMSISTGLTYGIGKFFLRGRLGYLYAKDTVNEVDVDFSGIQALLGAGIKF